MKMCALLSEVEKTTEDSLPVLQAQMNEISGSCLLGRESCFSDLFHGRAGAQGNDDMTEITGCCKSTPSLSLPFIFSLPLSASTFILPAEVRRGFYLGFKLDLTMRCFRRDTSSLFLLLPWMSLYWMFSSTIDLQWDMDLESELTKSNWEKILCYRKYAFSVACSF